MRDEFKIIILISLLNILLSQIIGDDNISRIILSNKISTNQSMFLDEFKDVFTGDIIDRNGHYISSKSPGISFSFSLISYIIDKLMPDNETLTFIKEDLRFRKLSISNLPISINAQALIAIALFSALPGSLLIMFFKKYTKNIYIALLIYLASLLFPFSTTLFSYIFSIFIITFAFVKRHKILTPILLGLSVFFELTSIFLTFIVLFYLRRKVNFYYFLIGLLPSIIYFSVFHDVLAYLFGLSNIPYHYYYSFDTQTSSGHVSSLSIFGIIYDIFKNSIFILFSLYRGVFVFFPLILLFFVYYRNFNIDIRKIALYSFIVYLIFNSLLDYWWGSLSFGPRHMIFSMPFIILAISSKWREINKKIFYALILFSIFVNISSFTYWEGARKIVIEGQEVYVTGFYKKGEITLKDENELALTFPLLQHYFVSLIENGPRSKLIESLFTGRSLDLRYLFPEDRDYFNSIYPYPPYLFSMILILLTLIFFYSEIRKRTIAFYSLLILLLSIFVYNLYYFGIFDLLKNVNKIDLKFGFYPNDSSGNIFVYKKGIVYIFSNNSNDKLISINLRAFHEDKRIKLIFNGENLGEFNISSRYDNRISFPSYIKKGKNVIEIVSDNCIRPIELNISNDKRCASLIFNSIDISELNKKEPIFIEGFFIQNKSLIYLGKYGKIYIYSENDNPMIISIVATSFIKDRSVSFYLNSQLIESTIIFKEGSNISLISDNFVKGWNTLEIKSSDCSIPSEEDKRCISLIISDIETKKLDTSSNSVIFSSGWYSQDNEKKWMSTNGKLYIYSSQDKEYILFVNMTSFLKDREASFYLNSDLIGKTYVFKEGEEVYLPVKLKRGLNSLEIMSEDCSLPNEEDKRCISVGIFNFNIIPIDQFTNEMIMSEGWYLKTKEDDFKWGSHNVKLIYVSENNATVTFYFDILTIYNETTKVEFYLNREPKNIFEIARGGGWVYTLPQKIRRGVNYLEFRVPRGCVTIDSIFHNKDNRCIAMTLRGIMVKQ